MRRRAGLALVALSAGLVALPALFPRAAARAQLRLPDGSTIAVELAATAAARARGLSDRPSPAEGMLLAFDAPGPHPIWMLGCSFPLDIVWLGVDERVIHVVEAAPPCAAQPCPLYRPAADALFVLELPAHTARAYKLDLGAQVQTAPSPSYARPAAAIDFPLVSPGRLPCLGSRLTAPTGCRTSGIGHRSPGGTTARLEHAMGSRVLLYHAHYGYYPSAAWRERPCPRQLAAAPPKKEIVEPSCMAGV